MREAGPRIQRDFQIPMLIVATLLLLLLYRQWANRAGNRTYPKMILRVFAAIWWLAIFIVPFSY